MPLDLTRRTPMKRRAFLRAGLLGLGGLNLAQLAAARESSADTSVILLYLHGGPSQLETYDLKPKAPIEYRSVFSPIHTNVPGMDICEHFPLQAKLADKFSLVRSLNHDVGIHSDGGIIVLTGKRPTVLDQALSALIEDVFARDLDRRIMVVVMGEFGRTPRLSHNANGTGRDHWPQAYSALVSGGGLRMGRVVGETNAKAEYPIDRPYSPQDLLATIYRHLRIDPDHTFRDFSGRPIAVLPSGAAIKELV